MPPGKRIPPRPVRAVPQRHHHLADLLRSQSQDRPLQRFHLAEDGAFWSQKMPIRQEILTFLGGHKKDIWLSVKPRMPTDAELAAGKTVDIDGEPHVAVSMRLPVFAKGLRSVVPVGEFPFEALVKVERARAAQAAARPQRMVKMEELLARAERMPDLECVGPRATSFKLLEAHGDTHGGHVYFQLPDATGAMHGFSVMPRRPTREELVAAHQTRLTGSPFLVVPMTLEVRHAGFSGDHIHLGQAVGEAKFNVHIRPEVAGAVGRKTGLRRWEQ